MPSAQTHTFDENVKPISDIHSVPGFSIDLNFRDVMTSKLKKLDVSVQNLEVMQ